MAVYGVLNTYGQDSPMLPIKASGTAPTTNCYTNTANNCVNFTAVPFGNKLRVVLTINTSIPATCYLNISLQGW